MHIYRKKKSDLPNLEDKGRVAAFQLAQNEPNPFREQTTIRFYVAKAGQVTLRVLGWDKKQVCILYQGEVAAGWHAVVWKGETDNGYPPLEGHYQYRLEGEGFVAIRTLEIKE